MSVVVQYVQDTAWLRANLCGFFFFRRRRRRNAGNASRSTSLGRFVGAVPFEIRGQSRTGPDSPVPDVGSKGGGHVGQIGGFDGILARNGVQVQFTIVFPTISTDTALYIIGVFENCGRSTGLVE